MMTKQDKIELLMLLSTLEAFGIAKSSIDSYPDYILATTECLMAKLKADILEESHD